MYCLISQILWIFPKISKRVLQYFGGACCFHLQGQCRSNFLCCWDSEHVGSKQAPSRQQLLLTQHHPTNISFNQTELPVDILPAAQTLQHCRGNCITATCCWNLPYFTCRMEAVTSCAWLQRNCWNKSLVWLCRRYNRRLDRPPSGRHLSRCQAM
jgi:hypothetical protein